MKVAKSVQSCLFGARYQLPPDSTLGEIDAELEPPIKKTTAGREGNGIAPAST